MMKSRFEPRLPRMSSWKNSILHNLDLNSGPLEWARILSLNHQSKITKINISFIQNCHSCRFGRFVSWTGVFPWTALWALYVSGFDGPMSKNLLLMQGSRVEILSVKFIIFSCWHPRETRFKFGFHSSLWDIICGIWNWVWLVPFGIM